MSFQLPYVTSNSFGACDPQGLGADEVVDYTKQTVDQAFKDNPFDAVIDQIGGDFAQNGETFYSHMHYLRIWQ